MNVVDLIKAHEGYRKHPYYCTGNKLTVGYGRNLQDVGIDQAEAEFLLQRDIDKAEASLGVERYWGALDSVRKAVLIDMVFNLGWAGFSKFKKLRAALESRDYAEAARQMEDSQWFKQVGSRARRLQAMMLTGQWP